MSNKMVNNVCKQFLDGNISKIIEEYCKFRKKAILNKTLYGELLDEITGNEDKILNNKWYVDIYDCLKHFVSVYENPAPVTIVSKEEQNRFLIQMIFSTIENVKNDTRPSVLEAKYAHLYLMLDMIWAYVDKDENKLQFSAIIYDMIGQINEENGPISFYKDANGIIIKHTFHIIQIVCEEQNFEPIKYIQAICEQSNQDFVKEFGEKLKELARKGQRLENTGNLKSSKETLDETIQENSLEKTNNQSNGLRLKVGIAGLVIAMFAGGFMAGRISSPLQSQLEEKTNEVLKLSRELDEYEKKEREQKDQISELKKQLFALNNSPQETETDETETDSELETDTQSGDITVDIQNILSQETEEDSETEDSQQESESQETDAKTYTLPKERRVRSEKSLTNNENILDELNSGTVVTILEAEDAEGWMYIQYESEDGTTKKGYIYVK